MPTKNTNQFGEFQRGNAISKKANGGFYGMVNCDVNHETCSCTSSYAIARIIEE